MTIEEFDKLQKDFNIQKAFKSFTNNKIPDISMAALTFVIGDKVFRYDLLEEYPDLFNIIINDTHNYILSKKAELDAMQITIKEET